MTWPIGFSSLIGCSFLILEEAVNPESAKDSVRYRFERRLIALASFSVLHMSVSTLENLLKLMREKLPQKDLNHTIILAIDEIIREVKRLDVEVRRTKRTISRRF